MKGLVYILIAATLLFFSFQEKREMVVSQNQVHKLIDKWNEIQGKGDSAKLARLYTNDEIFWNGKTVTLSQLLANKLTYFTTPVLKQDILPKSLILKGYTARGGLIKCEFTLLRKIDGKVREYHYYLLLAKESGKLKIMGEGESELSDESLLGLPMTIINVDVKDLPEETLMVISGRSYFYPLLTSSVLVVLVIIYVIMRRRKTANT
ncbi:MAG TPA: hypothetical protein VIT44_18905 [Cyclobacteriaceae bacterium]